MPLTFRCAGCCCVLIALSFCSLPAAAGGGLPDLRAPGAEPVTVEEISGDRVKVTSPFWRMEFDLRGGGALDSIVFPHGSGRNVLTAPFRTYVDGWSDAEAPAVESRSTNEENVARLEFSGHLGAHGRKKGPVAFRTVWIITARTIRADCTLWFESDLAAGRVGVGSTALRGDLDEFGLRVGPGNNPRATSATYGKASSAGSTWIDERHPPMYMVFFRRNVEGFDITTGTDLAIWESGLARKGGAGRFQASVSKDGAAIEVLREPLSSVSPVTVRKGEYTFSYYLGLPRLVEKSDRKWRHIAFGNHPWPSDELIGRWAENGVNVARLHNDYVADENFWHDGSWPPYDEKGMSELRRVIATCRRHKIRVVPYFSIHEFHPKSQGYAANESQWKRSVDQAGTVFHNRTGQGEFGAQMCLQSGWLQRLKTDVERAYRELGFDGIYYDWSAVLPCNNKGHDGNWHLGSDGMMDILAWTRRLIGSDGTLIVHVSGWLPSFPHENYADLLVNAEEASSGDRMMRKDDIALMTYLAEGVPRSPCPAYGKDRIVERNRNKLALMVAYGAFPWSGQDGPVAEDTLRLFHAFQPYRLQDFRLYNADSGALRTSWDDVQGAVYASPEQALVVLSNPEAGRRKNVIWRVSPERLGYAPSAEVNIRDTASGRVSRVPWQALEDGSLATELEGFEYKLFEVRPVR